MTLLATPQIIAMDPAPVAVTASPASSALNRLHTEQEIVICFAGGMRPLAGGRPGDPASAGVVTVINLIINLWIQPLCYREMRTILMDVRADIATTLIRPGEFTHPSPGLTVFAQSMDQSGEIKNLFLDKAAPNGASNTYMAAEGRFAKRGGDPVLILHNGSLQQFSKTGELGVLSWEENVLPLKPFLAIEGEVLYHPSDRYLHELFFPDLRRPWERANLKKLYSEGHGRLATPLYDLAFMSLALAAVLGGAFSRLGYGVRIAVAGGAGVTLRVLGFVAGAAANGNVTLNVLQYTPPLLCFIVCMLIVLRQHPGQGSAPRSSAPGCRSRHHPEPSLMGALGRLQVYVLTRTLAGLAAALVVIASVVMLICFVEISRAYGGRGDVGFTRLVEMMLLQSPSIILLLLPFTFLFGTMAAFVTLNRRSELIAMRAAGVSAWRFIFPAVVAAFLIGIVDVGVLNPVAADLNGRYEDAKNAIDEGLVGKQGNSAIWLRQGDEHTQIVIHAQAHDMQGGVVHRAAATGFRCSCRTSPPAAVAVHPPGSKRNPRRGSTPVSAASQRCPHEATPGAGVGALGDPVDPLQSRSAHGDGEVRGQGR